MAASERNTIMSEAAAAAFPGAPARSLPPSDDPLFVRATWRADVAAEYFASARADDVLAEARRVSARSGLAGATGLRAAFYLLAAYAWAGFGAVSPHTYGLARRRFDAACILLETEGR